MYNDFNFFKMFCKDINTEFKINRDKGTVTCIITTREDFLGKIIKYGFADCFDKLSLTWDDDHLDVRKYVGVARCSPEDEWDELYGKQLAEYRAMKARKNALNHEIDAFIRRTYNNIDNLSDYGKLREPKHPDER